MAEEKSASEQAAKVKAKFQQHLDEATKKLDEMKRDIAGMAPEDVQKKRDEIQNRIESHIQSQKEGAQSTRKHIAEWLGAKKEELTEKLAQKKEEMSEKMGQKKS